MFRADRLAERRKQHKLTQEQLAFKVNLTKAAISNYEKGRSAPPHETLAALVDALQTNADYLLDLSDYPDSNYAASGQPSSNQTKQPEANEPQPDSGVYIAYLGGPPEEMDEEEAEHLKRELEMFRAFKEKRRKERESHNGMEK
ncbi:helix-turn-helix transcriptional regulator [Paenibacillus sp. LHD-117]|uniref:helix-turn-helix domain-containing protein n=1 Tax=Paenibacillus sp. LHD-117 TaxID=3071412 RepID=UPI0027DF20E3|nr:helix-turn-helix transcriptional regulator [Paenibacillus sp. LHD-117]MDQ6420205.1 helix-turn-helix transcriptional regulator [Paenibacillus sp. LHD-117]